jgi:hypothetical protein
LVTYFELLDKELTEGIDLIKAYEADASRYRRAIAQAEYEEERYGSAHSARDEPPDRDYLLRLRREYLALQDKVNELQDAIVAKYEPTMKAARKRLEMKYGDTFHDAPKY